MHGLGNMENLMPECLKVISLIKPGGFYVIDDMLPQANWPEGHDKKAEALVEVLEKRSDLSLVKMDWSTGVIVGGKDREIGIG